MLKIMLNDLENLARVMNKKAHQFRIFILQIKYGRNIVIASVILISHVKANILNLR